MTDNIYISVYDSERVKEFADFLAAAVEAGDPIEMVASDIYGMGELKVKAGDKAIEL